MRTTSHHSQHYSDSLLEELEKENGLIPPSSSAYPRLSMISPPKSTLSSAFGCIDNLDTEIPISSASNLADASYNNNNASSQRQTPSPMGVSMASPREGSLGTVIHPHQSMIRHEGLQYPHHHADASTAYLAQHHSGSFHPHYYHPSMSYTHASVKAEPTSVATSNHLPYQGPAPLSHETKQFSVPSNFGPQNTFQQNQYDKQVVTYPHHLYHEERQIAMTSENDVTSSTSPERHL